VYVVLSAYYYVVFILDVITGVSFYSSGVSFSTIVAVEEEGSAK
jgi:hypothetical protein